jgi:hypothetical protein
MFVAFSLFLFSAGSPALPINNDSYLAFFHSSGHYNHHGIQSYVMGAYLFSRHPPFAVTHISPEPIMHDRFINESLGWAYKATDFIIFPGGLTMDDNYFYVSYGKNDGQGWIIKLKKAEFLSFLRPVTSVLLGESEMNEEKTDVIRGTFHYVRNCSHCVFDLPPIQPYLEEIRQNHEKLHHHSHHHHHSSSQRHGNHSHHSVSDGG